MGICISRKCNTKGPNGDLASCLSRAHSQEFIETHDAPGQAERQRQKPPGRVCEQLRCDEMDIAAADADLAPARREHVPHPVGVGPIPQPEHVVGVVLEHEERRAIRPASNAADVSQRPEARAADRRTAG
jgi:hypothetical protein